jgi:flagellar basal-body rod protein FlgF
VSNDIYPSLSGAVAAWQQLEVVAGNLANASTVGFKEHRIRFQVNPIDGKELSDQFVEADMVGANMSDGPLLHDDVDTHLALRGRGFFTTQLESGEEVLLRSGVLQIDANGYLSSVNGDKILGEGGEIYIPPGTRMHVTREGLILDQDGETIDQLRLLNADELEPLGGTRWRAVGETYVAEEVEVIQGALEGSNADPLMGMTELINASRYFEAYQKAMRTSDELDGKFYDKLRG